MAGAAACTDVAGAEQGGGARRSRATAHEWVTTQFTWACIAAGITHGTDEQASRAGALPCMAAKPAACMGNATPAARHPIWSLGSSVAAPCCAASRAACACSGTDCAKHDRGGHASAAGAAADAEATAVAGAGAAGMRGTVVQAWAATPTWALTTHAACACTGTDATGQGTATQPSRTAVLAWAAELAWGSDPTADPAHVSDSSVLGRPPALAGCSWWTAGTNDGDAALNLPAGSKHCTGMPLLRATSLGSQNGAPASGR